MKIFTPTSSERKTIVNMTKREFELVKDLNITNVIEYYEFNEEATWIKRTGQEVEVCYLLMELVDGVCFFDFLNASQGLKDDCLLRYIFIDLAKTIH